MTRDTSPIMTRIERRHFDSLTLSIDGTHFIECTFRDCVLEYSGQPYVLERSKLSGCRYVFFGPARGTVHFLQSVGLILPGGFDWCEFPTHIH
jgi:hypothetical protein